MKTVVITGSARGLGYEITKVFKENNINVVISDLNEERYGCNDVRSFYIWNK